MTIEEYIKSHLAYSQMPYMTVYRTIIQLISDGILKPSDFIEVKNGNVENAKPQPEGEIGRGLYSAGDFHSNR